MKVLWFLLIFQTAAIAQTPSVADAARQERERRKNLPVAPVITNQTIRDLTAPLMVELQP